MFRGGPSLSVPAAFAALLASLVLLVAISMALAPLSPMEVALSQVLAIATPAIALASLRGGPVLPQLGLVRPRPTAIAGALCLGASAWFITLALVLPLVDALSRRWDVFDPSRLEELEKLVFSAPPAVAAIAFVIAPAICEEILFRGALARAIAHRAGAVPAILLSGVLFGLFHFDPVRAIPTAILGIVLGYAAVVTGSIVPAMVIHLLNNAITLAVEAMGPERLQESALFVGPLCVALFVIGVVLIWRARPRVTSRTSL